MENVQQSNIKFVRLITGEDLVTELVYSEDMGGLVLYNPMKVVYFTTESSVSLTLIEWIFSSVCKNQMFPMSSNNVLVVSDVTSGMEQMYFTMLTKIAMKNENKASVELLDTENPEESTPVPTKTYLQDLEDEMLAEIQSGKRKLN